MLDIHFVDNDPATPISAAMLNQMVDAINAGGDIPDVTLAARLKDQLSNTWTALKDAPLTTATKDYFNTQVRAAGNLATSTLNGLMSAGDKAKLDAATELDSVNAPNTLVKRNAVGATQIMRINLVNQPTANDHATRKDYVDGLIPGPATVNAPGTMSAADKTKLDAATAASTDGTLALRYNGGETNFKGVYLSAAPVSPSHATRKDYVDGLIKASTIAELPFTASASAYPQGVSIMATGLTAVGWPTNGGLTVTTFKSANARTSQTIVSKVTGRQWTRSDLDGTNWNAFQESASTDYADGKVANGELLTSATRYGTLDPTGVADSYATLQAAINATPSGGTLYIPPGTYLISATLTSTGKSIYISAFGVKIVVAAGVVVGFELTGGIDTIYPVTAITPGTVLVDTLNLPTLVLTTTGATGYKVGDVIKLVADDAIPGGRAASGSKVSRVGQFLTVYASTSTTVTVVGDALIDPFTTNIRVARMKPLTCRIDDLTITAADPTATTRMFHIFEFINPTMNNIRVEQSGTQVFTMVSNYGYNINNPTIGFAQDDTAAALLGYGVSDTGCFAGKVNGMVARFVRHAYTDGTDQIDPNGTVRRYGRTIGTIVSNSTGHSTAGTSFDTHQYSVGVTFDNCQSYNSALGFALRGRKHTMMDCYAYKPVNVGLMIFSENPTDGDSWGHIIDNLVIDTPLNQAILGRVNLASNVIDTRVTRFGTATVLNAPAGSVEFMNMTVHFGALNILASNWTANNDEAMLLTRSSVTVDTLRPDFRAITSAITGLSMAVMVDNSTLRVDSLRARMGSQTLADKFLYLVDTSGGVPGTVTNIVQAEDVTIDFWKASSHLIPWADSNAASYVNWRTTDTPLAWSSLYTQFSTATMSTPVHALSRTTSSGVTFAGSLSAGNTTFPALRQGKFMGQQVTIAALTGSAGATLTVRHGAAYLLLTKTAADVVLNLGDSMDIIWDGATWRQVR